MRILCGNLLGQNGCMKILLTANASSSAHHHIGRRIPRLHPRAIAIQALCMGIVLFDFLGAIMGLSDFVITIWNHHPLLTIVTMTAAILSFAGAIELGIESLRADSP